LTLDVKNANLDLKFNPIPAGDKYLANSSSVNFTHTENQFNDFTVQTLLPNYLSRPGPTMAKADFNGDGIEDLFIGGASGQAGALFTQGSAGDFIKKNSSSLEADAQYEDTAAEFFDAWMVTVTLICMLEAGAMNSDLIAHGFRTGFISMMAKVILRRKLLAYPKC
jgi:hypothetical protein